MMLGALLLAAFLTWIIPSGRFQREHERIIPGSYTRVEKAVAARSLVEVKQSTPTLAYPASLRSIALALPSGMKQSGSLIFMIMCLGGMFAVLRATGALDAGLERLLALTRGRISILVPVLMLAISAGSTFLGLISEYLLIIPVMVALSARLGLSALFGLAVVAVPAKIGYLASVANPVALSVAQPLVGLQIFSGWPLRLLLWLMLLGIGIVFIVRLAYEEGIARYASHDAPPLDRHRLAVIASLGLSVLMLVYGGSLGWKSEDFAAFYVVLAVVIAALGGLDAVSASRAFVDGMKSMTLAGVLVGMAAAIEIVLRGSMVLDTIVDSLSELAKNRPPYLVAQALFLIETLLGAVIPSTSAKAAISMPILGPIGQLSGVTPQTTVLAFLCGNGLMNMISPTSGMLLAYLATANVSFSAWLRFLGPLFAIILVICLATIAGAVALGYQ
jgi:uncharacterized ion transporter superfamily protein YfcC